MKFNRSTESVWSASRRAKLLWRVLRRGCGDRPESVVSRVPPSEGDILFQANRFRQLYQAYKKNLYHESNTELALKITERSIRLSSYLHMLVY